MAIDRRWVTAIHEAGHAIVALAMGDLVVLKQATVLSRAGQGGYVWTSYKVSPPGYRAYACMMTAGEQAELLLGVPPEVAARGARADHADIADALDSLGIPPAERPATIEQLQNRAHGILVTRWQQVEAVARELHARGQLGVGQVQAIVKRVRLR